MKTCVECGSSKALSEFYSRVRRDKGHGHPTIDARCKDCVRAQQSVYRSENAESVRAGQTAYRLKNKDVLKRKNFEKNYGITWGERNEMLAAQGGACAICKSPDPKGPDWHMDHDHGCCPEKARSCGNCLRGLLCGRCNVALGCFGDDPEVMAAAAQYVSRMRPVA